MIPRPRFAFDQRDASFTNLSDEALVAKFSWCCSLFRDNLFYQACVHALPRQDGPRLVISELSRPRHVDQLAATKQSMTASLGPHLGD